MCSCSSNGFVFMDMVGGYWIWLGLVGSLSSFDYRVRDCWLANWYSRENAKSGHASHFYLKFFINVKIEMGQVKFVIKSRERRIIPQAIIRIFLLPVTCCSRMKSASELRNFRFNRTRPSNKKNMSRKRTCKSCLCAAHNVLTVRCGGCAYSRSTYYSKDGVGIRTSKGRLILQAKHSQRRRGRPWKQLCI